MTPIKSLALSFSLSVSLALPAWAQSAPRYETDAPQAVILDYETDIVLFEKNARAPMKPASMTKIMTARLVFDEIRAGRIGLDTTFTVSENAWRKGGAASGSSTMFLKIGEKVTVDDLLKGVIVVSGNDACIVLAEGLAGSESAFADMMTAKAREMGLSTATFKNSTGWPAEGHEISALDLARMSSSTIRNYPELYNYYAIKEFTWNDIKQPNRNPLLGAVPGADGLKTGSTQESGYGFVGSAERAGQRKITVVNGLSSKSERRRISRELMTAAFETFKVYDVTDAGEIMTSAPVYMGKADTVNVIVKAPIKVGLYRPNRSGLTVKAEMLLPLPAPISKGDVVGTLIVEAPGMETQSHDLLAAEDVALRGAFARALAVLGSKFGGQS